MSTLSSRIDSTIRNIPDFPQPGIQYKDITPVLADAALMRDIIGELKTQYQSQNIDVIVGVESRGFIFGTPLALDLNAAFVPVRKPGKLPADVLRTDYTLEYGSGSLEIHADAIQAGQRVVIVDDLLATGGTLAASKKLVEELGGVVVGCAVVINLAFLNGAERLNGTPVVSLVEYS
jgi:adenine phosphoribosyltransferase